MKQAQDEHWFFYVDETGDASFYGKGKKLIVGNEGCSRTFGVGFQAPGLCCAGNIGCYVFMARAERT